MKFIDAVKERLKEFNISDDDAKEILQNIESEVGHNENLIKAVLDAEGEHLIKRLRKKKKKEKKKVIAYV